MCHIRNCRDSAGLRSFHPEELIKTVRLLFCGFSADRASAADEIVPDAFTAGQAEKLVRIMPQMLAVTAAYGAQAGIIVRGMGAGISADGADASGKIFMCAEPAACDADPVLPYFMPTGKSCRKMQNPDDQGSCKNKKRKCGDAQGEYDFVRSFCFHSIRIIPYIKKTWQQERNLYRYD